MAEKESKCESLKGDEKVICELKDAILNRWKVPLEVAQFYNVRNERALEEALRISEPNRKLAELTLKIERAKCSAEREFRCDLDMGEGVVLRADNEKSGIKVTLINANRNIPVPWLEENGFSPESYDKVQVGEGYYGDFQKIVASEEIVNELKKLVEELDRNIDREKTFIDLKKAKVEKIKRGLEEPLEF